MNRAERRRIKADSQAPGRPLPSLRAQAVAALEAGRYDEAEGLYARCLDADAADLSSLHDLGVLAARRGRHAEAVKLFEHVLARTADHPAAWLNMALSLGDEGRYQEAEAAARKAIALQPRNPAAHTALGHVLSATPDLAGAAAACGRALALDPSFSPALLRRARVLRTMRNFGESLASCDALARLRPDDVAGLVERGLTLTEADRSLEAEDVFREVLARDPANGQALMGLSRALLKTRDKDKAIAELDRGILDAPGSARLHLLRGLLKQKSGQVSAAQADLKRAIELDPSDAVAYVNMSSLLLKSERYVESVLFAEHALRLQPTMVDGYVYLAEAHRKLGHYSVAITLLEKGFSLAPERIDLCWMACWARMNACAWEGYAERIRDLKARAIAAGHTISPFMIMAFGLSDHETHLWTRAWAQAMMPEPPASLRPHDDARPRSGGRIRLGYLSADFRAHATAVLVSELFRLQNRDRFELVGYNIGQIDRSSLGLDMMSGLGRLVNLVGLDDREAAARIAADEIDILIDLKGFTTDSRPGILAYRPAPIQVNYLGYPGSMGTPFVDYIVADRVVAPFELREFFDEAIVQLPHSYQPNDRRRPRADPAARREAQGLPATGFVFCCFNNNYKLTPLVFSLWMRLLGRTPGSVLWLLQANDVAETNLRSAAVQHGIDGERLIFAPRAAYEGHLARLGLADLFLDTLPVNAHTTASEALWCGVPVLTCMGRHFTSRVAASLLTAVGLPELITTSLADYESEALALAHDPARLGALRDRLARNRDEAPLFDTPRYVRNYEAALEHMVDVRRSGLSPQCFMVEERSGGPPVAVSPPEPPPSPSAETTASTA